jgi:hypothetical protein
MVESQFQSGGAAQASHHAVFLGLYNSERFQPRISDWLPKLDLSDAHLYIADNCSASSPERWIRELLDAKGVNYSYFSNEKNFGGYGNLMSNLNAFQGAEWVTTLHQDDSYAPDHVQRHLALISQSSDSLGMICTEAVSENIAGKELPLPRGNWFLSSSHDPVEVFLAHLRNHVFPFSGATFRKSILVEYPIPWHSTAFPDTELVMKIASRYRAAFTSAATVRYLENPESESHSLEPYHRDFGAFQALIRVFSHDSYAEICELVPILERETYLRSLVAGIEIRFTDKSLSFLLRQTALELTSTHFGFDRKMAEFLIDGYSNVGDVAAVRVLRALSDSDASLEISSKPKPSEAAPRSRNRIHRLLALAVFRAIPKGLRVLLARQIMRSAAGKRLFPQWDFSWRSKP